MRASCPELVKSDSQSSHFKMHLYSGKIIHRDRARPLAFIDKDNQAFSAWGEKLITDRTHMKRLIEYAVDGGAELM